MLYELILTRQVERLVFVTADTEDEARAAAAAIVAETDLDNDLTDPDAIRHPSARWDLEEWVTAVGPTGWTARPITPGQLAAEYEMYQTADGEVEWLDGEVVIPVTGA